MRPGLFVRKALNRLFLRKWTIDRQRADAMRLAEGFPQGFRDEIGFWALELSGHGYHPELLDRAKVRGMTEAYPHQLDVLVADFAPRVPRVADVGSGPLSQLAFGAYQARIVLTAIDPLADVYQRLIRLNRLLEQAKYKRLALEAESLADTCGEGAFEIVWCRNALDHSRNPALAFRSMVRALAPGGYLVLPQKAWEGTEENWHGLHQHDVYVDQQNRLMLQSMINGRLSEPCCLSCDLPLERISSTGPSSKVGEWFEIVWRKAG